MLNFSTNHKRIFIKNYLSILFLISFFFAGFQHSSAQLNTSIDLIGVISAGDQTPFWLQSNQNGIYSADGNQFLSRFQAYGKEDINPNIRFLYGTDLVVRPGVESSIWFNQGFIKLQAHGIELSAGRFQNSSSTHHKRLSMGSLGVSGNATPIPQVRLGLIDWTSLPFTQDYIQIKGHLAHGWMGNNRVTDDVLYHEKMGHARFGGDLPLNLYGGVVHYATWGGNNNPRFGDLPSSSKDFWRVFFAVGGDDTAPPGEESYMLGNHLGAWDFGFFLDVADVDVKAYRQFPLETKNNLKFKSPQDALTGVSVTFGEELDFPIKEFVYEHLYTKWQNGPLRPNTGPNQRDEFQGNENYYNHTIYQTGWVYEDRTIGNALFTPRPDNQGVSNNRIVAHHVGLTSSVKNVTITSRATFSRNSGTWIHPFESPKNQWSFSTGIESPFSYRDQQFTFLTEAAFDNGSLVGDQFGLLLGIRWSN
ncbi:MAG: capsule assembly Wzi family protein [Balneolaceae bacterium]